MSISSVAGDIATQSESAKSDLINDIKNGDVDASNPGQIISIQDDLNKGQARIATATDIAKANTDEGKLVRNKMNS